MEDYMKFALAEEPTAEQRETIAALKKAFVGMGLWLGIDDPVGSGQSKLVIYFDQGQYDEHRSRGAGRRKKFLKDCQRVTVGEVRAKLADKSADEVASELGVSRSTLFRRIRDKADDERF